jgi:hypothetical protein
VGDNLQVRPLQFYGAEVTGVAEDLIHINAGRAVLRDNRAQMSPFRIVRPPIAADNDNATQGGALELANVDLAARSPWWHSRAYNDLLRPRLELLAEDSAAHARALAAQLAQCIDCRRSIRCETCPVARAVGRF